MEIRKNFTTFKSGDVVRVKPDFPYIDHLTMTEETYIIDKMLDVAGVVTLKNLQWNRTYPDDAFELVLREK
jgi:hypothetical protein